MNNQGVKCAWCQIMIKKGEEPYSHGICKSCAKEMQADLEAYKRGDMKNRGKGTH